MGCHAWLWAAAVAVGLSLIITPRQVEMSSYVAENAPKLSAKLDVADRQKRQVDNNNVPTPAEILSMNIESRTSSRYTQVLVESVLANNEMEAKEAQFVVQIPETAFISNYSMFINNSWFVADVLEKAAAEKVYKDAQDKGESAGHVAASPQIPAPRGMSNFVVSVNVAPESRVKFKLLYTELLQRRLGSYIQRISVRPGQVGKQFSLQAALYEPQGFAWFKFVPPGEDQPLESSREPDITLKASNSYKTIQYFPDEADQIKLSNKGLSGDFVIEYDVERPVTDSTGGVLIVDNGRFVHYISPSETGLLPLNKNVVFVIDVSGSMSGRKIEQTRKALLAILDQLRPNDYFNILLFSSSVVMWNQQPVLATAGNILAAKAYVQEHVKADGGTNIEAGLRKAGESLSFLHTGMTSRRGRMIVFLTDGMPTAGVTNTTEIRKIVRTWNSESRLPIFSLRFGRGVSYDFLKKLSWENYGEAREIFDDETEDADVQLANFFKDVEDVLFLKVEVSYTDVAVLKSSLTTTSFPQYYKGRELIIAGELSPSAPESWTVVVNAVGKSNDVTYEIDVTDKNVYDASVAPWSAGFVEKLTAYLKINELVRNMSIAQDETRREELRKEALRLSLKYNFVTPVTSMVVTQSLDKASGVRDEAYKYNAASAPGLSAKGTIYSMRDGSGSYSATVVFSWNTCLIVFASSIMSVLVVFQDG